MAIMPFFRVKQGNDFEKTSVCVKMERRFGGGRL
jgi:hypothetical protein